MLKHPTRWVAVMFMAVLTGMLAMMSPAYAVVPPPVPACSATAVSGGYQVNWTTVSTATKYTVREEGYTDPKYVVDHPTATYLWTDALRDTNDIRFTVRSSNTSGSANSPCTTAPVSGATNQAPSVSAGPDRSVTLPGTASLDGTVTDDGLPSGSSVTQTWTKVSGPGTVTFGSPNAQDTTAAFSVAGSYVLRLTGTDGSLSASDDVAVTVASAPTNTAPSVNAGADQTVTLPSAGNLDGTVSDDGLPSGSSVTQTWSKVSGPGTITFANPNAVDTTATFSVAGTYVARLTATDGALSASDDVTVTVNAASGGSGLPYTSGSFFKSRVDGAGVPIDATLTSQFHIFMANHIDQAARDYPTVNMNPLWAGNNDIGTSADPVYKLSNNPNNGETRLDILKTQGVHVDTAVLQDIPTGTQDRLLVVRDTVWGYTMQCADVVVNFTAKTFTASSCGIFWHTSNGLEERNPLSDDPRNFSSRGRIPDAMQVNKADLDAAAAAGTGLGRVLHIFFVETDGTGSPCFVHPMVGCESDQNGFGLEGTRLRIKPSVDLVARGLTGHALVLARTLQQNGGYLGDNSGGYTQLKIGNVDDFATGSNLATNVFSGKLHWTDFEVVQPGWQ